MSASHKGRRPAPARSGGCIGGLVVLVLTAVLWRWVAVALVLIPATLLTLYVMSGVTKAAFTPRGRTD